MKSVFRVSPRLGASSLITPFVLAISRQNWKLPWVALIMPMRSSTLASSFTLASRASSIQFMK